MAEESTGTIEVFYSYAPEDEELRGELEKHLSILKHQGVITSWYRRLISAGTEQTDEIMRHLNSAHVILLLISSDFLASEYHYGTEIKRAMERQEAGEARVIPILLRPTHYEGAPFEKLQMLPANEKPITGWSDRDEAFQEVAREISKAVKEVANPTTRVLSTNKWSDSKNLLVWNVPYHRNPFFTGREDLLKQLHDSLTTNNPIALTQAIKGLGGIGKTQTAVEYAYRYQSEYQYILWVNAATQETLIADFVSLAAFLHLSKRDEQDQKMVVDVVKHWLAQHTGWLLILDNADDLAIVSHFLPTGGKGHILLTTRAQATGTVANSIEMKKMDKEEATLLLLRRAKVLAPDTPLGQSSEEYRTRAEEIVLAMDGLPLAIDQAGAYIEETQCNLVEYLNLLRTHRQDLLQHRGQFPSDHPEPVATTWSLSLQQVEQINPAAAELLRLCAFLDPDAIPEEVITEGAPELGSVLGSVAADPFKLNKVMEALRKFSLVQRNPDEKMLSIHRLVQAVLIDTLPTNAQRQWAERAVRAINRAFPREVERSTWLQCQRCLPQAQACAALIKQWDMAFPEAAQLLNRAGHYLYQRGLYNEAEPLYQHALAIRKRVLGPEHPDTADSFNTLGVCYNSQGKYEQAEHFLQRALVIRKKVLGSEASETVESINNLGGLYNDWGKYIQAEAFHQRALDIRERVLGPEHPDVALSLNNLAFSYSKQGKNKEKEAEPLYLRALAIREKALGLEHPDVAQTLSNLAVLYKKQDRYIEAEPLYLRSLKIREQALGPEHPSVANIHNNLGMFYYTSQGKDVEAEQHFQRALAICEKSLGAEHPNTVKTLVNYADLLRSMKRDMEAVKLEARVRAIRGKLQRG